MLCRLIYVLTLYSQRENNGADDSEEGAEQGTGGGAGRSARRGGPRGRRGRGGSSRGSRGRDSDRTRQPSDTQQLEDNLGVSVHTIEGYQRCWVCE